MTVAIRDQRRRFILAEVSRVVPGLYAWLATVLTPTLQRGVGLPARVSALMALVCLLAALLVTGRYPRPGRVVGVYGFVAFCLVAWACLGSLLRSDQLDPVRGALGAAGFLLHALAWGAPPKNPQLEPPDNLVAGVALQPRHKPAKLGALVLGCGVAIALAPMAWSFAIERPRASLLAHAFSLACGILVIGASTDVALRVGKQPRLPPWRARIAEAIWPLGCLVLAIGIGLIWLALR